MSLRVDDLVSDFTLRVAHVFRSAPQQTNWGPTCSLKHAVFDRIYRNCDWLPFKACLAEYSHAGLLSSIKLYSSFKTIEL